MQLLSCLGSEAYSNWEPWDKKVTYKSLTLLKKKKKGHTEVFILCFSLHYSQDSGWWSLSPGDDFSSGVFSYNSQPDVQVFSMDLLGHTQLPPPCCFEGEKNKN